MNVFLNEGQACNEPLGHGGVGLGEGGGPGGGQQEEEEEVEVEKFLVVVVDHHCTFHNYILGGLRSEETEGGGGFSVV